MVDENQDGETVTFTFKKSYLNVALAFLVGFGTAFGIALWVLDTGTGATTEPQAAQEAAQQQAPVAEVQAPSASPGLEQPTARVQISVDGRPFKGPEEASVTLVEFTDYQCPFCRRHFEQTMPDLLRAYEGRIKYVVLNFPIASIHPSAQKASEAAECAFDQGKFWEYHDTLFTNQQALDVDSLKQYARDLSLDAGPFDACLDSGAKTQLVLADVQAAHGYGVSGTPTFFINGESLVGARPLSAFRARIDTALAQAEQ